ncbi:hypothetical protein [Candidatus Mycoplasma haematominutum]|uniref:Uncharacterized protein n=1 Tax=Candidatus Mycoplasma haematominutum 'Birmingham 1' TaxID=1116213 RepID=G8C2U6_9MOLU|nr:hypothetical protein [Candidatus Mycoplasma haematominutum]CCE66644.1 hypothetical protein MHM_01260 [Candidatus Mycoplasma haematominutum 'Birmingham 1']
MGFSSRSKLCLSLTAGGSCAIGTPVFLHYTGSSEETASATQADVGELTQVSSEIEDKLTIGPENISQNSNETDNVQNQERESKFSELWTKITGEYLKKQTENKEASENILSWKTELQNILLGKSVSNSEWRIEAQEYKDCASISGGKTDYCGYLKLKIGGEEYRLKFDRYGKGGGGKKWAVTLVTKNGSNIQWYSKTSNKWDNSRATNIDNFQGSAQSANNWWSTLTGVSIEI